MRGLEFALNDIGLAVFTTLAPAAAFAYVALALLVLFGRLDDRARRCLESWLILPLALATLGLISSATHLGNPGNALYVFNRVGNSPLSTEVLTAVVFLGVSCSYWLAGVYLGNLRLRAVRFVWLALGVAGALAFVWGTTNAYGMSTVVTWDTTFARANLPLTGLAGCAELVCLVLACSGQAHRRGLTGVLAGISAVATVVACVSMALQDASLDTMRNGFGTAAELVPLYPVAIAAFVLCSLGALALTLTSMRRFWVETACVPVGFGGRSPAEKRLRNRLVATVALVYLGTFAVRFCFYCLHMTSGVV